MTDQEYYYEPSEYDTAIHNDEDRDLLLRVYEEKRLKNLVNFYENRIRENQRNSDFTFKVSTAIMTIASLLATISASVTPSPTPNLLDQFVAVFPVFSAVLPAFAALLGAFRQLYGWDRQVLIYRDSLLGLERVRLHIPDEERMARARLEVLFPKVVMQTEDVFAGETAQWGQFVLSKPEEAGEPVTAKKLSALNLSDEQIAALMAVVEAGSASGMRISAASHETRVLTAGELEAPDGAGSHTQPQVTMHETTYTQTEITLPPTEPTADESAFAASDATASGAESTSDAQAIARADDEDDPSTSAG